MKGNRFNNIILTAVLLAGLSLLLYPSISDYLNDRHSTKAIMNYIEQGKTISDGEYEQLLGQAEEYNRMLYARGGRQKLSESELEEYNSILDITGTGILGYIEIPAINCRLPIYHGTSEAVLQVASGHIEWSSLPVGGENTHAVISGHRGLPSAKIFSDLPNLVCGDIFMIRTLNRIITYEVDQILIVEPDETEALRIAKNEDLCTLVTCTPYGVNTHRLLVRGHRVENQRSIASMRLTSDAVLVKPVVSAAVMAVPILILLLVFVNVLDRKKH